MTRFIASSVTLLSTLVLVGCQPKSANSIVGESTVAPGPQFSAKNGLLVPEETRQTLGVKIVEVEEQKITATINIQLRVYEVTKTTSLASGTVTSEQAKQLQPGQPVQVRTSDGGSVTGKIAATHDQWQKATGMVEVIAEISNEPVKLDVGAFLQASCKLESGESVVTIPRAALLQCSDGYSVYTVSGEHLLRTPVKVGVVNAELVEIKDGLYSGDQVVLQPVMSLWLTELAAVNGGQACCLVPPKGK